MKIVEDRHREAQGVQVLENLQKLLRERRHSDPAGSYVAGLYHKGLNKILEKVGEEAIETVLAAKDVQDSAHTDVLIHETADLWFHTMVMLTHLNLDVKAVLRELERRFGCSGLIEKANR